MCLELKFGTSPLKSYWVFNFLGSESSLLGSKPLMLHIPPTTRGNSVSSSTGSSNSSSSATIK